MSEAVRQAIADAANTVDGINCTPYYRQTTKAGDAMVRLDRIEYPNAFGGIATWNVLVILPQDISAAEKYIEATVSDLTEAIGKEVVVRRATPQQLALDTGAVPVLFIEGTRETDD